MVWGLLLAWRMAFGGAEVWQIREDFSSYPEGSLAAPVWETTGIEWEVRQGEFVAAEGEKTFALLARAPQGRFVAVEATLRVEASLHGEWKVAGLVLWQNAHNYWHLALVEAPESLQRRHFVELVESWEGRWLAQSEAETRLTMTEGFGADFDWQYGRPYRLRLELTPEGIRGTVRELDGTERARLAFRFDHPRAVTFGKPGLDSGGFRAAFDDVVAQVKEVVPMGEERKGYPPFAVKGDPTRRARATGFFRVEEQQGRWWLFTPQGEAFYILGTDHARYQGHWCEKLGYAPYHRVVQKKYGNEEAWAQETLRRLKAWGFNTLTAGHSPSLRYQGLAHTEFLSLGAGFAGSYPLAPRVHWTGFPNVFHPKFPQYCEKVAQQRCAPNKEDPWLLGYFLDNELEWYGKPPEGPLLYWAMSKPAEDPAKQALVAFFRQRYKDIAAFNRAWGTQVADFEALLPLTGLPRADTKEAEKDRADFLGLLAERYFAITTSAIRKQDPNHLILGCRFAGNAPEAVWRAAGKYCDIVSVNIYPRVDLEQEKVLGVEELLQRAYSWTQRPLMVTEWSFPALDAVDFEGKPLPSRHGAGMRVDNQEQKARCCELMQRLLFRLPFVVGSDYFMWVDEPALGISSTFPEDSNYGLVSERDEPYEPLVSMFARLNPCVYRIHAGEEPKALRPSAPPLRYLPGRRWHRAEARTRWAVVLRGGVDLQEALVTVSAPKEMRAWLRQAPGLVAYDEAGQEVMVQRDMLGEEVELTFRLGTLPAGRPFTFWLYPGPAPQPSLTLQVEHSERRLIVDNGVLRLVKEEPDGDAWDRVEWKGAALGRFTPLIHQRDGQDLWVPPERVVEMKVHRGPLRVVVEMVFERGRAGEAITEVGAGGVYQPQRRSPRAFRTAYRFFFYPGQSWFLAQFLWLENIDSEGWHFVDYFHYIPSFIGGSVEGDEVGGPGVPNYYLPFVAWKDEGVGLQYGAVALREGDFLLHFWLDEGGRQHPDARREVNLALGPGRRFSEAQPRLLLFGGPVGERPSALVQRLRAWHRVETLFGPLERR